MKTVTHKTLRVKQLAYSFFYLLLICQTGFTQNNKQIFGFILDSVTNEAIPFVSVMVKGEQVGTSTNVNGLFNLTIIQPSDTICINNIGYRSKCVHAPINVNDTIFIKLQPNVIELTTIQISPGKNPAIDIIKQTIQSKKQHNKNLLKTVQYLSYTKQETDIDNISEKFRKRKLLQPITSLWDSLSQTKMDSSSQNLPVAFSEVVADIYMNNTTKTKHEDVHAVRLNYVGMKDDNALSKITGTDFQRFNFYYNNINILDKAFLSPIADNALLFYRYYIVDTTFIDNTPCIHLNVIPKNKQDLTFNGSIWISMDDYHLKQVDLKIGHEVNFNLVNQVSIQQKLLQDSTGTVFPAYNIVEIDYANVTKRMLSLVTKTYNYNSQYIANQPKDSSFYNTRIQFAEDAVNKDSSYWENQRPIPITTWEKQAYVLVDSIRNVPVVKTSVDLVYLLFTGYKSFGQIDVGHYMQLYSNNKYEGDRLRLGVKTNEKFSDKWIARAYTAYGFRDKEVKYNLQLEHLISRYPWSKIGIQHRYDIDQVGVNSSYTRTMNLTQPPNYIYNMFAQIGNISQLVFKEENRIWYENSYRNGLSTQIAFQNITVNPLFDVSFGNLNNQLRTYSTAELIIQARYSLKERYIQNGNERISLGNKQSPIIGFSFLQSFKNILESDYNYQKIDLWFSNRFKVAPFGYSKIDLKAGKIFSSIPYTSLIIPRGNETYFSADNVYNQMNFFEFVSDQYIQLFWQHHFMGVLFNRVPLIKKLKLRETLGINMFYGTLSDANANYNSDGIFTNMTSKPYVEVNTGIENLFKLIKIDFVYRLTYTDDDYMNAYSQANSGRVISKWGIKTGLRFAF